MATRYKKPPRDLRPLQIRGQARLWSGHRRRRERTLLRLHHDSEPAPAQKHRIFEDTSKPLHRRAQPALMVRFRFVPKNGKGPDASAGSVTINGFVGAKECIPSPTAKPSSRTSIVCQTRMGSKRTAHLRHTASQSKANTVQ
jgi:hypothetical protein